MGKCKNVRFGYGRAGSRRGRAQRTEKHGAMSEKKSKKVRRRQELESRTCALCRGDGRVIKSHILPSFVLDPLRNQNSQLYKHSVITRRQERTSRDFINHLLCETCDNEVIGSRETRVSALWEAWTTADTREAAFEVIRPLFQKSLGDIKYFIVSIFWRLSVADSYEYQSVKLESDEEDELRQYLLTETWTNGPWTIGVAYTDPWDWRHFSDTGESGDVNVPSLCMWQGGGVIWSIHKGEVADIDSLEDACRLAPRIIPFEEYSNNLESIAIHFAELKRTLESGKRPLWDD